MSDRGKISLGIYGTGAKARVMYERWKDIDIVDILCFFDNKKEIEGCKILDKNVVHAARVNEWVGRLEYIVIVSLWENEIYQQLHEQYRRLQMKVLKNENELEVLCKVSAIKKQYGWVGLNVGCGKTRFQGYLNCDLEEGDCCFDATETFPFTNDTFNYVYSEHFIEHLSFDDGVHFLRESQRVLQKGGRVRCLFPDLRSLLYFADKECYEQELLKERLVNGIIGKDGEILQVPKCSKLQARCWDGVDDVVNAFMRSWGHKYMWSATHLKEVFAIIGFNDITVNSFGVSRDKQGCPDPVGRWGYQWTKAIEAKK